jgi:hypothetical protein
METKPLIKSKEKQPTEGLKTPLLVVSGRLKGICKTSGQEYDLVFADRVDYDENGNNPVVWYKTTLDETEQKSVSGLIAF